MNFSGSESLLYWRTFSENLLLLIFRACAHLSFALLATLQSQLSLEDSIKRNDAVVFLIRMLVVLF